MVNEAIFLEDTGIDLLGADNQMQRDRIEMLELMVKEQDEQIQQLKEEVETKDADINMLETRCVRFDRELQFRQIKIKD